MRDFTSLGAQLQKGVADSTESILYINCFYSNPILSYFPCCNVIILASRRVVEQTKLFSVNAEVTERCDQIKGADESRESQRLLRGVNYQIIPLLHTVCPVYPCWFIDSFLKTKKT